MDEAKPAFQAPPGACDTHFHVFGPPERYPGASNARYQPPHAPLDDYLAHVEPLGIQRMVVVQPSAYGRDNRCTLDTLRSLGSRARAIVDIDESASDDEIQALHDDGVRGVRINVSPVAPFDADLPQRLMPRIDTLAGKLAGSGWVLEFLGPGWLTEALIPRMRSLAVDFIVDHMGTFRAAAGPEQPGFRALLELLAANPRCWIKLTGVYRISTAPGYADVAPLVAALLRVAPDRLIWGSDFPHLSFADRVDTVALFNLLAEWLPTDGLRRKILVDNPQTLFGFADAQDGAAQPAGVVPSS